MKAATQEQTGKGWKTVQIVAACLCIGSILGVAVGRIIGSEVLSGLLWLLTMLGLLLFAGGRFGHWWTTSSQ